MARIELAVEVGEDFERILEHLKGYDVADPTARVEEIIAAIDVLTHSPLMGRPASGQLRELIIGRRSRGYVALYRYVAESDIVFILAIRAQREAGYESR
jgi:plasmid stabilization system protein ParE